MARYWVGGTGNWNDTAHWSTTDGGSSGAAVPTSSDDVYFTNLSSASNAAYTATVNATANCLSLDMAGPGASNKVTFAGSSALNIYGSMALTDGTSGITWTYTGVLTFRATSGTVTINTNGVAMLSSTFALNGSGGTFQLTAPLALSASGGTISYSAGTLDQNGNKITVTVSGGTTVLSGSWAFNGDVEFSGTSGYNASLQIGASFSLTGGTLTIAGSNRYRLRVFSSGTGTSRTITAAAVALSYANFTDIAAAGAATWSGTEIGDAAGNSGSWSWSTPKNRYWVGDSGSWYDTSHWTANSDGTGSGASVPLTHDTAVFNAYSFTGTGKTVSLYARQICAIDGSGSSYAFTLSNVNGGIGQSFYGNVTMPSGSTLGGTGVCQYADKRGTLVWTVPSPASINWGLRGHGTGTTFRLGCSTSITSIGDSANPASFDLNGFDLSCSGIIYFSTGATLSIGSGTLSNSNASGTLVNIASGATVSAHTGKIVLSGGGASAKTFAGGGKTYNNVEFTGSGDTGGWTITGSNTFTRFYATNGPRTFKFTAGTTTHFGTFDVNGTSGNLITLDSSSTATYTFVKDGGGTVAANYLSVQHCVATPSDTWLAYYSTNNQSVTTPGSGWSFVTSVSDSETLLALTDLDTLSSGIALADSETLLSSSGDSFLSIYLDSYEISFNKWIEAELNGVGGGWTDITSDVYMGSINLEYGIRGLAIDQRVAESGTLSFTLRNDEGNSGGLVGYYSLNHLNTRPGWNSNIRIRLSAGFEGSVVTRWMGWLDDAIPEPGMVNAKRVFCTVLDYQNILAYAPPDVAVQLNKTEDEIATALLDASTIAPVNRSIGVGPDTYPYAMDTLSGNLLTGFQDLCLSSFGYQYTKRDATDGQTVTYEPRTHRETTPAASISLPDTKTKTTTRPTKDVTFDRIIISYTPRYVVPRASMAGAVAIESSVPPTPLAPGASETIILDYTDPAQRDTRIAAMNVVSPVAGTDYTCNSAADGSGTNLSASVSVVMEAWADCVYLTFTNNHGTLSAYRTKCEVRGDGIYTLAEVKVQAVTGTGRRSTEIRMPFQDDPSVAQGTANTLATQYLSEHLLVETVSFFASQTTDLIGQVLLLDIGDTVYVQETVTGIDQVCFVNGIKWEFGEGRIFFVTLWLAPTPSEKWILNKSKLGVNTRLGA